MSSTINAISTTSTTDSATIATMTAMSKHEKKDEKKKKQDVQHPGVVRFWLEFYRMTPKVHLFGQDIGFLMTCFVLLYTVRHCCWQILVHSFDWPSSSTDSNTTNTWEAAACAAGIFHTLNLVPVLGYLLWSGGPLRPSAPMSAYPKWWQHGVDAMMQLCCAHMIHDALFGVLALRYKDDHTFQLNDMDPIYLAHHAITFSFMMSNLYLQTGQTTGIVCMFWGEMTNPVFNANTMAQLGLGLDCCNGVWAAQARTVLELANAALFVPIRGIIFPFFSVWFMVSFYFGEGTKTIPLIFRLLWSVCIWGIVMGSLPFVPEQLHMLLSYSSGQEQGGDEL